jgi:chromosome condensin MukBEF complex kleisin-like MukF subunit
VGVEIISQLSNKIEIEFLIPPHENNDELDKIERRIYYILKETFSELIKAIDNNFKIFSDASYDYHDNITKFINYYLRELHLSKKTDYEKKAGYSFYALLDTLVDKIRHLCESIEINGCNDKIKNYLQQIFDIVLGEYDLIISNKTMTNELITKRYKLKEKIESEKFTLKEYKVISEILFYLETLNISSEYMLAKYLKK